MNNFAGPVGDAITPDIGVGYYILLGVFLLFWGAIITFTLIGGRYWYSFLDKVFKELYQTPKGYRYILYCLFTIPVTMIIFGYAFYSRNNNNPEYLLWSPILGAAVHLIIIGVILKLISKKLVNSHRREIVTEEQSRTITPRNNISK